MTTIRAGYRVTVTTWENDGDNYSTKVLDGLSEEAMMFVSKLLELFGHSTDWKNRLCNIYDANDYERARVHAAVQKIIDEHPGDKPKYCEDAESVMENLLYDLGITSGEFYTRVVERYIIEYVPSDINFEVVTKRFKGL